MRCRCCGGQLHWDESQGCWVHDTGSPWVISGGKQDHLSDPDWENRAGPRHTWRGVDPVLPREAPAALTTLRDVSDLIAAPKAAGRG